MDTFTIQRSFDSRTHKIKEWNAALKAHGKVAVPPQLASDIEGWRKYGDTKWQRSRILHLSQSQCHLSDPGELGGRRTQASGSESRNSRGLISLVPTRSCDCSAPCEGSGQADPRPASPLEGRDHQERLDAAGGPETLSSVVDLERRVNERKEAASADSA